MKFKMCEHDRTLILKFSYPLSFFRWYPEPSPLAMVLSYDFVFQSFLRPLQWLPYPAQNPYHWLQELRTIEDLYLNQPEMLQNISVLVKHFNYTLPIMILGNNCKNIMIRK